MGYKILLADDSVTVQKIITLTFSDEGVDVVAVNNGDEAISRLQYLRPALVMADVSIPGRNGYEICEFVKTHPEMKETPVILLVPAFEPFDEDRARRIGADYHLTKPFQSIRTLISTVKNLVERRSRVEFSVAGSGLTAVRAPDQNDPETTDIDPKRAKIDELIRLSAQVSAENPDEDEVLLEVDVAQGGARSLDSQLDLLTAEESPGLTEVVAASHGAIIEGYPPRAASAAAVSAGASGVDGVDIGVDGVDMDDVLELDDVLPEIAPTSAAQAIATDGFASDQLEDMAPAESSGRPQSLTIPQSVIDEIVDRVTAQLTERLSGAIARRIASEVAEIVKPQLSTAAAYLDSDNLLDID